MKRQSLWIVVIIVLLLVSACGGDKDKDSKDADNKTENKNITIKLVRNGWVGSDVNVTVAKILLEEELGYTVEIVDIDEYAQWDAMVKGDVHAALEVWPSGHQADREKYIEQEQTIEYGGEVGIVGQIGWYVPTYVLRAHPELISWEGFVNRENTALFADEASDGKGVFWAGDPTWVQNEAAIIENLGLNLMVRPVEGEDAEAAILAKLDAAYAEEKPILFYFWFPHWIHARYDLEQVTLPEYSAECYSVPEDIACGYPDDPFFKIFWVGLKDYAPDAYQFLQNFSYTSQDQISMMAAVQLQDKTVAEAARDWIDNNPTVWKAWLP